MRPDPRGQIYMSCTACLQGQKLAHEVHLPPAHAAKVPSRLAPEPKALAAAADLIAAAKKPVIIAEFVGREPEGFHALVELAETGGIPVYDVDSRLNFPTRHPLNMSMAKDVFRDADLILCLDARDWERPTTELVSATRQRTSIVPEGARWVDIGFGDLELSSWALDYQRLQHADLRILADTSIAIPMLTELLQARLKKDGAYAGRVRTRAAEIAKQSEARRAGWPNEGREDWAASPVMLPARAAQVWDAIKGEDWGLTANTPEA